MHVFAIEGIALLVFAAGVVLLVGLAILIALGAMAPVTRGVYIGHPYSRRQTDESKADSFTDDSARSHRSHS
ncbi:hypothetical protein ACWDRB_32975 [Nonomuraea sp. NPDC003707]|uniref:hypothetical protein n=1 Tax=Nonomuraea angiospora TaxID=46172 RepID=UPI003326E762